MPNLTLRKNKNSKLSIEELDNNFIYLDGKSSSLLPNGVEIIETSRTYSRTDAGKLLMIGSASLTMPSNNPFEEGDIISISCQYNTSSFNTEFGGDLCYMLPTGNGSVSENVLLQNTLIDGEPMLISLSGGIKYDIIDNKRKTISRYLYDNRSNQKIELLGYFDYNWLNSNTSSSYLYSVNQVLSNKIVTGIWTVREEEFLSVDGVLPETMYLTQTNFYNTGLTLSCDGHNVKYIPITTNGEIAIDPNETEPYGAYVQINLSDTNPQNFTSGMFKVYIEYKEPLFI